MITRILTNPLFGFGCLTIFGMVVAFYTHEQFDYARDMRAQVMRSHETLNHIHVLMADLAGAESGVRGFVITGRDEYLTLYERATGGINKLAAPSPAAGDAPVIGGTIAATLAALREMTAGNIEQQNRLDALENHIGEKIEHMKSVVKIAWAKSMADAQAYMQNRDGKRIMDDIKGVISGLLQYEQSLLENRKQEAEQANLTSTRLITVLTVLLLCCMAATLIALYIGLMRHQRLETDLSDLSSFQDAVQNSSHYAIIATDTGGVIRLFNPAAARMFGYTSDELIGKETMHKLHDAEESLERAGELSRELNEAVDPGFEVYSKKAAMLGWEEREWIYHRKNGTLFPGVLTMTPTYDQRGYITGYLGVIRDNTEQKKISTMRNELIATVSHEMRAPLVTINGVLGLLLGNAAGDLPEKAKQMIANVYDQSTRLKSLVDDLLDIEKIESRQIRLEHKPMIVDNLLQQTVDEHKPFADHHRVRIAYRPDAKGAWVAGDAVKLRQAVANLLSNAIKFSPAGEKVVLSTERTAQGVRISVVDNGPGIPDEFKHKIFNKFAHADDAISRQHGSVGLGLNLTKLIVETMGGMIRFDSAPGRTVFSIILPEVHAPRDAAS